ncbi:MAG TPA: shikimate kinase [Candidatus Binatia bacterium]|nr:shikimate kinase [Candidatus Binatia bacterium]
MAVGKSAVGRSLAKKLGLRFVDLDRLIEKKEGKKVPEIFAEKGERYFRQLEKQALAEILRHQGQVIATGGGVVLDEENLALLRERALVVRLSASVDVLLSRSGGGTPRPLLSGADRRAKIEELLAKRESRYAQAHATIDTSDLTIGQVVEMLVELIGAQN